VLTGGGPGAYALLALIVAAECVGIPLPGETALIAAGALARRGDLSLPGVIAVAAVAAILGDSVGYAVGRHGGRRLLVARGPLQRHRRMLCERGEPFFERHGPKAVFLARWVAWVRLATPLLAGASAMPYRRFVRWNVLGAVAWAVSIGVLAYALGSVVRHLVLDVALVTGVLAGAAVTGTAARKAAPRSLARSFAMGVAPAALLAVALRAPFFTTPLGVDEGGLAFVAQHWVRNGTSVYGDQWLDRPPLLVLLFRAAFAVGGDAGVRILGALAAVALVAVVAALARALGGARAGRCAAVAAAVLASSIALQAVYTPAELLAAVPASASVLCLVAGLRSGRAGWLGAAGALATSAFLVKQSFVDAALAGTAFLAACAVHRPPDVGWRRAARAWLGGAAVPALAVLAAGRLGYVGRALPYALVGFRIDALRTLGSSSDLRARGGNLLAPALTSGLVVAVVLVPLGLRRLRGEPVLLWTLAAWLAGGLVGVLAGGTYWAHYLIEIVPVSAVLSGLAIADRRPALRNAVAGTAVALACGAAVAATVYVADRHPHGVEREVGDYIHAHARSGDTQYVLYARANVLRYAGLPTPFPYDWSLMVRATARARPELYRLLGSARRPTWLVAWQDDDRWRLDRGGVVDALLRRNYRPAATVAGHLILRRVDPPEPRTRAQAAPTRRSS